MKTILVVEDFAAVQRFLRETLESKGYKTIGSSSGKKAYELLANLEHRPGLVITDYHMPDGNGFELVQMMKDNPALASMPVIYLTSEDNPDIMKGAATLGYHAWIAKPYRPDVLLKAIEKVFDQTG